MSQNQCLFQIYSICFETAQNSNNTINFFGFSEFLATTAIFVVAYSISDERYKLRVANSRLPFQFLFLFFVGFVGFMLVLVEIWFNLELPTPKQFNNILYFQYSLALLTLAVICYWLFVAFVRPPKFSRSNALKFTRNAFSRIAYGNEQALITLAQEIIPSAEAIFDTARKRIQVRDFERGGFKIEATQEAEIAQQLISTLGNPRFCRIVAQTVPALAAEIFHQASKGSVRTLPLDQFSRNIAGEFFADPTTAIHYEGDGFRSGLIGYVRPISKELFEHLELVEELADGAGSPLDPMWWDTKHWGEQSWETYVRCALSFLEERFKKGAMWQHSQATYQICYRIENMCSDAYLIEEMGDNSWESLPFRKVQIACSFIEKTLDLLEEYQIYYPCKIDQNDSHYHKDIYDQIVEVAYGILKSAANVRTAEFKNWQLQHNIVWSAITGSFKFGKSRSTFAYRFQRRIYSEIIEMEEYYNYEGARVLSFCLNVMGLHERKNDNRYKKFRALHRWLLRWVRLNYLKIFEEIPDVADNCLSGTITFDEKNRRLVKTYRGSLGKEPQRRYLELLPVTSGT